MAARVDKGKNVLADVFRQRVVGKFPPVEEGGFPVVVTGSKPVVNTRVDGTLLAVKLLVEVSRPRVVTTTELVLAALVVAAVVVGFLVVVVAAEVVVSLPL